MQKQRNYLEKKLKTPMNKDYNYFWKQKKQPYSGDRLK